MTPTPLGDALRASQALARELVTYPLDLAECSSCQHVFLPLVVEPDESYSNYFFETSKSPGLSASMQRLAFELWANRLVVSSSLVVDIGSNDGTWLGHFMDQGAEVLGVEPSQRLSEQAASAGIETINDYFTSIVAQKIRSERGAPAIITANFVTANVPNLQEFFGGLRDLSGEDTIVAITTGYHPDQFRVNMFDFIYHEHVSYFTAQDFVHLAEQYGFSVIEAQRSGLKGGSLRVLLRPSQGSPEHHVDVQRIVQYERWAGIREPSWFHDLQSRVSREISRTHQIFNGVKAQKVLGYGMSHSVTTLLYHFDLVERVSALTDDNAARQGLFSPGQGLPILSPAVASRGEFDTTVILAWQHDGLIRNRLANLGWVGNIVQPLPGASLIQKGD
jgi:hypothetical protein